MALMPNWSRSLAGASLPDSSGELGARNLVGSRFYNLGREIARACRVTASSGYGTIAGVDRERGWKREPNHLTGIPVNHLSKVIGKRTLNPDLYLLASVGPFNCPALERLDAC